MKWEQASLHFELPQRASVGFLHIIWWTGQNKQQIPFPSMSYKLETQFNMNDQYSMYPPGYNNPSHRSPSSNRGYNGGATINRQPSRQFDDYASSQPHRLYPTDDQYGARYESGQQYESRMLPPMTGQSPRYAYDNHTWSGFGGQNSSTPAMSNNSSRSRSRIPNVSYLCSSYSSRT